MTKHIILDYDGTLVNSKKAICKMYNKEFKSTFTKKTDYANWKEVSKWNMSDQCPKLYEEGRDVIEYFAKKEFFEEVEYYKNVFEVMENWREKEYDITICTAGCPFNVSLKTLELDKDFPNANIIPVVMKGSNGVGKKIVNMEGAIFIDDHIENLITSNAKHKIWYLNEEDFQGVEWGVSKEYLKENNITKVGNWKELEKIVNRIH